MRESYTLEFKENITNTFLKTVSAFANYHGGIIKFGINDKGEKIGISNPTKIVLDIENKINDSIKPIPNYRLEIEENNIINLIIENSPYKPYFYKGKAYKRSDTATIEMDQLELKRLILLGSNTNFEELEYDDNLTFSYLQKKFSKELNIENINDDILRTLGFYTKNKKFNNAAALISDTNKFPGIDMIKFGENFNEINDRYIIENVSILKQYDKATSFYKKYYQKEIIKGIKRETVSKIPEEAFRETIANAIVHRSWDISNNIKVAFYDDKIEVISPGTLPSDLSEKEYLNNTISSLKNPIIANVFFRLKYIEKFGTGIKRIIESYRDATLKPIFQILDNYISVTLPIISYKYNVTTDEKIIIDFIENKKELSSGELVNLTTFNKSKVIRLLNKLIQKKYIKTIGVGRSTKYKLF